MADASSQTRLGDHGPGRQRRLALHRTSADAVRYRCPTALVFEEALVEGGRLVSIANVDPPQT